MRTKILKNNLLTKEEIAFLKRTTTLANKTKLVKAVLLKIKEDEKKYSHLKHHTFESLMLMTYKQIKSFV